MLSLVRRGHYRCHWGEEWMASEMALTCAEKAGTRDKLYFRKEIYDSLISYIWMTANVSTYKWHLHFKRYWKCLPLLYNSLGDIFQILLEVTCSHKGVTPFCFCNICITFSLVWIAKENVSTGDCTYSLGNRFYHETYPSVPPKSSRVTQDLFRAERAKDCILELHVTASVWSWYVTTNIFVLRIKGIRLQKNARVKSTKNSFITLKLTELYWKL